jgi:tetratricopeptide (TPR) repeat protein
MKPCALFVAILFCLHAQSQDPVTAANKCYETKDYECAMGKYKEAIADKKYVEKDLSLIKYRIGFSLTQLKRFEDAIPYLKESISLKNTYGEAYWSLAWAYYSTQAYALALSNYEAAIPYYKENKISQADLHYGKGISNAGLKKYEDVLACMRTSLSLDSTNDNCYSYSGEASYYLGKYKDAIYNYQKAIEIGGSDVVPKAGRYYWIGQSWGKLNKYDEAIAAYNKAIEVNPKNRSAVWGLAAVYYNQGKFQDALTTYTKTTTLYGDDTASLKNIYYWRGRTYNALKQYDKAASDFESALKIDPNYRDALWQRAFVPYNKKQFKEALAAFTKTIDVYKGNSGSLDDLYYFRGHCYFQLKDTVNAEKDFKESLYHNSSLSEPNVYMGDINFGRKKYYEARNFYGKGASNFVGDTALLAQVWFRKGFCYLNGGDSYYYTAKEDLVKSLKYDSTNREAHRYLADAYYMQKNFALAEKELDKCIVLYKKDKDSLQKMYTYRGMVRSQTARYSEALADYEAADKINAFKNALDVRSLAQLAFEVKDYDKTIKLFNRLLPMYKPEQKTELMFVYFGRGRAALEQKKKQPAVTDLKKALELAPGNAEIQTWLTKAEALN